MKKLSIKILVCLLAITSIFGLVGMKSTSAVAEEQYQINDGFYLKGAGLRKIDEEDLASDVTGIQFENVLTQKAYKAILEQAKYVEDEVEKYKRVYFGVSISGMNGNSVQDIVYVASEGSGYTKPTFASDADDEEFYFHAGITFNDSQFEADLRDYLGGEYTEAKLAQYKAAAYGTLLNARSFYQIEGEEKQYVDSIARSMSMVANYYVASGIVDQTEWNKFYASKNYFTVGDAIAGTYYEEESGKLMVSDLTLPEKARIAYKAQNVPYSVSGSDIILDFEGQIEKSELGKNIEFYVFDTDNKVTTISVKYVTKLISTAEDLQYFNVDYTFDEAVYQAYVDAGNLDEAKAYVEKCMAEPFTYFDGYYVMVNDITLPSTVNSTVKFTHPAVVRLTSSTQAGFTADNANGVFVANHPDAMFVSAWGDEYALPRAYYPVVDAKNNYYYGAGPTINFKRIGLMGTFDGQGHIIENLQTGLMANWETSTYGTPYYYINASGQNTTGTSTNGAGLFGVLSVGGAIKNVGFTNMRGNYNSAGLVGVINQTHPSNMSALDKETYPNWDKRATIENVYMKIVFNLSWSGNLYGALWYADAGVSPITKNVLVDAEGYSLGDTAASQNGRFGIMPDSAHANASEDSGAQGPIYLIVNNPYHTSNIDENDHSSDLTVSGQLTQVTSLNALFTTTDIVTKFAGNDYWVVAGNAVYFKPLYDKATVEAGISLVDDNSQAVESITYDGSATEFAVKMVDAYGDVNAQVTFSEGAPLSYVDGKIVIDVENIDYGTFTATFTSGAVVKEINVDIPLPTYERGYLQEDGEWVESGITDIEGLTFKVDGIDATASVVNNKLMLDWEGSLATSLGNKVSIVVYKNDKKVAQYNSMYVTLAIDEASELNFSVGYTFNQAEYEAAPDKVAYAQEKAAQPFDYYDGYYVLVKDIDASGIEFVHDALGLFTGYKTADGFKPDETNNVFVAQGNATLVEGYAIPREGYPMMFDVPYDYPYNYSYPQTVKFVKIGFMGTFDGQGHIISNVNTKLSEENYKTYSAGTEKTGAGIFGTINYGAVIKNVGFTNLYVENSAGLALHNNMNGALDATADSVAYPNANKALIEDVYIQVSNTSVTPKGIIYNTMASTYNAQIRNVVVVANGVANIGEQHAVLNFLAYNEGYGGGIGDGTNGKLYLVVDTTQHTDKGAATRGILKQVTTLNELFTTTDAVDTLGNREYWETVTSNGVTGVYFIGTYASTIKLVDGSANEVNSLTFTVDNTSATVTASDNFGAVAITGVTFDTDALTYVDGAIKVVDGKYAPGTYTATFAFGENGTKSITITLEAPVYDMGYLQEDGEWVESGITDLTGLTFMVDGIDATASIVEGKLMLDWEGSLATTLGNKVSIVVYKDGVKQAIYNSLYVTVAIDEGTDLNSFSVGYTFDQAEFDAITDDAEKVAYLEACEANPFDYYEGYYVLTKDINASGVKFYHYAVGLFSYQNYDTSSTQAGFRVNDSSNVLEPLHEKAMYEYNDVQYAIPREGYPIISQSFGQTDASNAGWYRTEYGVGPRISFKKIGFMGTFDGQGYVISNAYTDVWDAGEAYRTKIYVGETLNTSGVGAGIFGIINYGATIKNVAFNNLRGNYSSAGLALSVNMRRDLDADDKLVYTNTNKPVIENVYIKVPTAAAGSNLQGVLWYAEYRVTPVMRNVVVVALGQNIGDSGQSQKYGIMNENSYREGDANYGLGGPVYIVQAVPRATSDGATTAGFLKQATTVEGIQTDEFITTKFADNAYWKIKEDGLYFNNLKVE